METLYFHDEDDVLVTELTPSADPHSEFHHTFGGDCQYRGKRFKDFDDAPRLIRRLDLNDPYVRIDIPGIRFLPPSRRLRSMVPQCTIASLRTIR